MYLLAQVSLESKPRRRDGGNPVGYALIDARNAHEMPND